MTISADENVALESKSADENVALAEVTDESQAVQGRWNVVDALVDVETKWWGYQLHLNQAAVFLVDECLELIDKKLVRCFKNPAIRLAVHAALVLKRIRLERVSDENGCRLVSPWICPIALTVMRAKPVTDLSLYTAVWDSTARQWGEESVFTDISSASGPGLAQHGDRLFCVYRGPGSDQNLYWMQYTAEKGWSDGEPQPPRQFPQHKSAAIPALVEFNGLLYCFHRGGGDENLWYCHFIPHTDPAQETWSADRPMSVSSPSGCAAAVWNNRLHVVFQRSDGKLAHISSGDGENWTNPLVLENHLTYDTPALAAYGGKLHMVHRGKNDEFLWHSTFDGSSWSTDTKLRHHCSRQGPALAVHDGLLHMLHRSMERGTAHLWYATYDGNSWSTDTELPNHCTGDNPALVSYMDPRATTENYEDPATAGRRLIAVYRGQ